MFFVFTVSVIICKKNKKDGKFLCPICRQEYDENINLESSRLHENLADELNIFQNGKTTCTKCVESPEAKFLCQDCGKFLCQGCKDIHKKVRETTTHAVLSIKDIRSLMDLKKFQESRTEICQKHEPKEKELFCEVSQCAMCLLCAFEGEHKKHRGENDHKSLKEKVLEMQEDLNKRYEKNSKLQEEFAKQQKNVSAKLAEVKKNKEELLAQLEAEKQLIIDNLNFVILDMQNKVINQFEEYTTELKGKAKKLEQWQNDTKEVYEGARLLQELPIGKFHESGQEVQQKYDKLGKQRAIGSVHQMKEFHKFCIYKLNDSTSDNAYFRKRVGEFTEDEDDVDVITIAA